MGGCCSCCRCKTKSKRGSLAETVPYSKDTAPQDPQSTLSSSPPKVHNPPGSSEPPEDKRVVVHETVSSRGILLKENQNLSLLLPPAREFSGKPKNVDFCDRQIPVKRRVPEKCPSKPRPEKVPSLRRNVPSRGVERATSRRLDSPEPRIPARKIPVKKPSSGPSGDSRFPARRQNNSGELEAPVKKLNSGDLRSSSPSARAVKGSRRIVKEGSDSLRRTSPSRRMHLRKEASAARVVEEIREVKTGDFEERSKGSVSSDSEKMVVEVAEKPRNVCEVSAESAAPSEALGDSTLPPIDLENPLISLDCFIFL